MSDNFISIRKGCKEDEAFIYSTWLRYFRHYSYFAKKIKNHIFFKWHQYLIERIMARDTTTVLVATPNDDSDLIMGYLVHEKWDNDLDVIHWIYVKSGYQHEGVARELLKESKINMESAFFSHWSYPVDELILKWPNLTYSPYHI